MPRKYEPGCAVWETTLDCNLSCSHCGSRAGAKRKKELTTEEALDLCEQLAGIGTKMVTLMGGEPLVRKDWQQLGLKALDCGMEVGMVSNGILIKKNISKISKMTPSVVGISLDGLEATHDLIRGRHGHFKEVMAAAGLLRTHGIETTLITTVSRLNFKELPALRDLIADKEIAWQVQVAMPMGRFSKEYLISPEEFYALCNFVRDTRKKYGIQKLPIAGGHCIGYETYLSPKISRWHGCQAGTEVIGIASDGGIRGCMSIPEKVTAGNIRKTSLRDIWDNDDNFPYTRKKVTVGKNCRGCSTADVCRGGCSSMSYTLSGRFNNNPYCMAHLERELIGESAAGRRLLTIADWVKRRQLRFRKR